MAPVPSLTRSLRVLPVLLASAALGAWFIVPVRAETLARRSPPAGSAPSGSPVTESMPVLISPAPVGVDQGGRALVLLDTPVTAAVLYDLSGYGTVHGWIGRYRLVAMTPAGGRDRVAALPYVRSVETDERRHLDDIGTWDRDLLDVTDVEETGSVGDPDRREVRETGAGVHVAVIDTGLTSNWRDFLVDERVETSLARAFVGGGAALDAGALENEFNTSSPPDLWQGDTIGHGTAVASHIIGFELARRVIDGTAPGARVIPLKVSDNGGTIFTSRVLAAIDYVIGLVGSGAVGPTVINMSLSGSLPLAVEQQVVDDAIAAGVIVVASAGNRGEQGLGWPGAYPEVISVGAVGWTRQFQPGAPGAPNFDFWWTRDVAFDPDPHRPPLEDSEVFVAGFSSRAIPDLAAGFPQELDVLAPGSFTVAPFPSVDVVQRSSSIFFVSGTSFSAPLTAGVAALMLERNPRLTQAQVESILQSTAVPVNPVGSRPRILFPGAAAEIEVAWDDSCEDRPCDAVGAGLVQADAALAAAPRP